MIVSAAVDRVVISADGVHALGAYGNREAQGIRRIGILGQRVSRIHEIFVGKRAEGSEDLRAAHDDAFLGAPDDARRQVGVDALDVADCLVDHRIDDGVRQRKIMAGYLALERGKRRAGPRVAVLFEQAPLGDEAGDGDIDVVGGAAEHPDRVPVSYTHLTLPTIYSV